ncbi:MAG: putative transport system permease protein, partial [Actinomycetota bacterium]|nr:putative transport system permease protein [Actinomycetota bacterium]
TGYTALVAWRAVGVRELGRRRLDARDRPSRIATALTGIGSPPSATVGATMAFESGRGPSAIPTRTALASAALAMTIVTGALTFGANLTRVADRPRLQGWNWDVSVGNPHSDDVSRTAIPLLSRNRAVAAFSSIAGSEGVSARINGQDSGFFGIDVVKGPGLVLYPEGRAPRAADEIAFGTKTMREHHLHIGQRVSVSTGGPVRALRITGGVLLTPTVVNDSVPLGEAAVVSGAALRALHARAPVNVFLVRFRPGVDRVTALRQLRSEFPGTVLTAVRPPDIENLQRVSNLPTLLAILFALIAVLTIGNALVSSVRRRGRELAVLRTLGFVRRQISAILAWQATTVAIIAIVIGLPLGIAVGRWTWMLVTRRLGLPDDSIVPAGLLTLVALIALLVANLLALAPSVLARRTAPATILRSE